MSIKDRLTKKTEGLIVPGKAGSSSSPSPSPLRTGPGQMLMVNSLMKENNEKVLLLEARIKEFEGSLPVRLIAAEKIIPSKWANRIKDSFEGNDDFEQLRDEIRQAEGNVQPIKVRPIAGAVDQYEIVFGHRRHRACLELGLPVLALIENVSDQELFKEMDRENRKRLDLSPWEQGRMYRRALQEGLFSSLGELSKQLGIDKGNLSKALRLAELPDVVVGAFPSPLDMQFRWAKLLNDAMQKDSEGLLARAKQLAAEDRTSRTPKEVLDILIGSRPREGFEETVVVSGKTIAKIQANDRQISIHFTKGVISGERAKELQSLIMAFIKG